MFIQICVLIIFIIQVSPHYSYHYGVHDTKHHDIHSHWEERKDEETKGAYSLVQPDGKKRIVKYEAGKHGANYVVKYEGHAEHKKHHSNNHKHEHGKELEQGNTIGGKHEHPESHIKYSISHVYHHHN